MKTTYGASAKLFCAFSAGRRGVSSGSPALTVELLMFVLLPLFAALMWEGNSDPLFVCQSICEDQSGWIMRHITSLPTSSVYQMTSIARVSKIYKDPLKR